MSSGYALKDFVDIQEAVLRQLKIPASDTTELERVKNDINDILINEVLPFKRWLWLSGHYDVEFRPYLGVGTVAVTPDSTTITFSVAPSTSKANFYFSVVGFSEIYKISAHTAATTTATLSTPYTGALNATASYKIWTDDVALPTDCRETIEVWHDFNKSPLEPLGWQEFRKRVAEKPKAEGRPIYYSTHDYYDPTSGTDELESDRYRVMKIYPSIYENSTTLHIDYLKEVTAMDEDTDEPPMPIEDRIVLVYGALMLAWMRHRNPEASEQNKARFEAKLARMAGKVEEATDKPQLTVDSLYISSKRGPRLKSLSVQTSGGGSSYTAPTYLSGATINGANLTAAMTVAAGITIDGRDISADGAALDALNTLANGKIYIGNASNEPTEVTPSGDVTMDNTGVNAIAAGVIVDADINASANISRTKIAAGTAYRMLANSSAGVLSENAALAATAVPFVDANGQLSSDATYLAWNSTSKSLVVGDPGSEISGINISGVTYESTFKVSDIDGTNYAQNILHRHSTVLEPLVVGARAYSDTSAHVDVTNSLNLFTCYGAGYAGSNYKLFGAISIATDAAGTISNTSAPGAIILSVTADGAVSPTEALRIQRDKSIKVAGLATAGVVHASATGVLSSSDIVNADVGASAAIALSKLAATTASRALVSDGSGFVSASAITATEVTYLDDVEPLTPVVLTDNTSNGTAITLAATFTAIIIEYSVVRGAANIDIGHIYLTNDGTNAGASPVGTSLGTTGVTFDAVVSGGNVILRYTTTSTGSNAALKYKLHKWAA